MKTKMHLNLCCRAAALLALLPLVARAAETVGATPDQTNEPATHVLFTGTDIQVFNQGTMHRVRDVEGGSFKIEVNGQFVGVPMGANPEKLKIARVQTITDRFVSVTNYKYERTYTPANSPYRKGAQGVLSTQGLQEQAMFADSIARKAQILSDPGYSAAAQTLVQQANQSAGGNMGSTDFYASEMAGELAQEFYDALEVRFEVSSATPVRSPYMVIVAKFHEKDDPKHPQNWIFAQALDPIGSKPDKVSVREGGFPPGFVVDKLEVHLYQNGLEIATDLSENRAPLTRDEAHDYFVINHVNRHKKDTLPARVALTKMPEDWATHPKDDAFRKTYYVKVDPTGHPVGSFEDEACETKVADAYYAGVLKDMLFLPALEQGKAVDGVARVKLSELPL
jgi:hypothetical protein